MQVFLVETALRNRTCCAFVALLQFIRIENFLVLLLAFIINLFVICVFAHGFYTSDSTPPEVR
jgi:hypothetical protein